MKIDKHVLFYDGECALCHFWVKFILKFDKKTKFLFSPLQGELIKRLISDSKRLVLPDSIIVYSMSEEVYLKSKAIFFILGELNFVFKIIVCFFSFFPTRMLDFFYDLIAKYRKSVFGQKQEWCPVLTNNEKNLFLE